MNVAFRVDASPQVGLGHLMRCLALSEELTRRGHHCSFVTNTDDKNLVVSIQNNHIFVQKMPATLTLTEDLNELITFIKHHDIDWVITDHYGINASYIKEIKKTGFKILSIDDTAQIHYDSDVVVNQNIGAQHIKFSTEPYTKLLLGPQYVMLRDKLLIHEKKYLHSRVKNILIMMGGADPDNFTLQIVQTLVPTFQGMEFLVVCGPFHPFISDLKTYIKNTKAPVTLIQSPKNMATVYLESDFAITAGGSSCYELAYYGIPSFIISVAENQVLLSQEMGRQHIGLYLGRKNEVIMKTLSEKVKDLLVDQSLQQRMSQNGRALIDGKGKSRIVDCMEGFS